MAKQSVGAGDRGGIIANILQVFLIIFLLILFLIIIFLIIVTIFQVFLLQTMYDAFIKTKLYTGLCLRVFLTVRSKAGEESLH